jgi:hypothetical protein
VRDHHTAAVVIRSTRRQNEYNERRLVLVFSTQPTKQRLLFGQHLIDASVVLPGRDGSGGVCPVIRHTGSWIRMEACGKCWLVRPITPNRIMHAMPFFAFP